MAVTVRVTRAQALGFRAARHGLVGDAGAEGVLGLGLQDTATRSAALALSARRVDALDGRRMVFLWSVRGARHLHRAADLGLFAEALTLVDDADADARFGELGKRLHAGGGSSADAVEEIAVAMRALLADGARPKGHVSGALRGRLPGAWLYYCAVCGADHLPDGAFRLAALRARVPLEPEQSGRGSMLRPRRSRTPPVDEARAEVVRRHLATHGPVPAGALQRWLGTTPATAKRFAATLPDEVVTVDVDGTRAQVLEADLDALRSAAPHEGVHLLAPNDPWLANGDRALVLPDRGRQKLVWRSLHSPGVVLVDGDVAGTWKGRLTGDVLEIAVSPFAALPERTLADLEAEAERVAKVRGAAQSAVQSVSGGAPRG